MAIKNILVAYDGSDGAKASLGLGLKMAAKYDAHLTGLMPHGKPSSQISQLIASHTTLREAIAEFDAQVMDEAANTFRAMTQQHPNTHWITSEGSGDGAIVESARYFDVTLIGQYDANREETAFAMHPDRIALQSGRPIIVVPRGYERALGNRAVVAWDGQRAAARALSDAMQILETKELVTILTVARGGGDQPRSVERLREHLGRHGIASEWVSADAKGRTIASTIVDWCREHTPDLLVMGAYEHSKFREDLVGGVTNSVLRHAPAPVLLAH